MATVSKHKVTSGERRRASRTEADASFEHAERFPYLADMQFLADASGKRVSVVIPIESFKLLMRDYRAIATAFNTKEDDFVDWEVAVAELRADGLLPAEG